MEETERPAPEKTKARLAMPGGPSEWGDGEEDAARRNSPRGKVVIARGS